MVYLSYHNKRKQRLSYGTIFQEENHMTLNQILYFRKVARLENYHQAAEELYISQPSLSRSMAALESELGITLFEKKGRGVVLTNAGRLFLEHADRIAGDCDIAAGKMKELASGGGKSTSVIFSTCRTLYSAQCPHLSGPRRKQKCCL